MHYRKILLLIIFINFNFIFSQENKTESDDDEIIFSEDLSSADKEKIVGEITSINYVKNTKNIPLEIVSKFMRVSKGDILSIKDLEYLLNYSKANIENNKYFYYMTYEYTIVKNGDSYTIEVEVEIAERTFVWSFGGNYIYGSFGVINLLGPASDLNFKMGYTDNEVSSEMNFINNSDFGLYWKVGHNIFDEFDFRGNIRSQVYASLEPFYSITPNIKLGILAGYRQEFRYNNFSSKDFEIDFGGFVDLDYRFLQNVVNYGFELGAKYSITALGVNVGTSKIESFFNSYVPIYDNEFFGIRLQVDASLKWQTTDKTLLPLYTLMPKAFTVKDLPGSFAWSSEFSLPMAFYKNSNFLALEFIPKTIIGQQFGSKVSGSFATAVGGGINLKLGVPVNIELSPQVFYDFNKKSVSFKVYFSNL